MGTMDDETQQRVSKLHMVLRPYLLRRLKRDVEKELPQKYEHLVMCPLSKRQRFLYDEFMERAETRHDLQSGVYQKIANILMQLRKVVNHPDLFEVRPIVTSFAIEHSAIADFEIKELLVRRRLLAEPDEGKVNMDLLGLQFVQLQNTSQVAAAEIRQLGATPRLPLIAELPGEPPPYDTRTIGGYKLHTQWAKRAAEVAKWTHFGYLNRLRCSAQPIYSAELIHISQRMYTPLFPVSAVDRRSWTTLDRLHSAVKSYADRAEALADIVDRFTFATPAAAARDLPRIALAGFDSSTLGTQQNLELDRNLHRAAVKLQIAFPDPSLLQYDCGKLQELARLLRERKSGGHRILIFTQMTRILDILETFLSLHGYLYLRLDGSTKIEDRQYITERFNSDARIFCFISSSRSGGVGIKCVVIFTSPSGCLTIAVVLRAQTLSYSTTATSIHRWTANARTGKHSVTRLACVRPNPRIGLTGSAKSGMCTSTASCPRTLSRRRFFARPTRSAPSTILSFRGASSTGVRCCRPMARKS